MSDQEVAEVLRGELAELRERLARAELKAARYDALCSIMTEAIMILDRDGRYVHIEPTSGFPQHVRESLIGTTLGEGFPPAYAERMLAGIRHTLATGTTGTIEFPVAVPHGELWAVASFTPLGPDTVLWYSNDITTERRLQVAEQGLRSFEAIIERTPDGVAVVRADGRCTYTNQAYRELSGLLAADAASTSLALDLGDPGLARDALAEALAHGYWSGRAGLGRDEATRVPCQLSLVRLPAGPDSRADLAVIARDLRAFLAAERERVELQDQVIAAQRAALRELSTPLLPLADGVLCMPLVGAIDAERAQEMMERLLTGIVHQRAHTAILDVTGVRVPDAQVAEGLLQVARAARLLGARVLLTGVGPEVAQTLVELEADLRGITTLGDLQSGITHALRGAAAARARVAAPREAR